MALDLVVGILDVLADFGGFTTNNVEVEIPVRNPSIKAQVKGGNMWNLGGTLVWATCGDFVGQCIVYL